jgi:DNA-binding response OmpR family regulator
MSSSKTSVLVVDDDARILRMMQRILELEGYRVLTACNGKDALDLFIKGTPDLVLLDIIMPALDGHTLCQLIRESSQVPIIMVTAKCGDGDKVKGLDIGADDYMTKPFSASELIARVRAILRRIVPRDRYSEPVFQSKGLTINFTDHMVTLHGQELNLTKAEYKLLSYMALNANRVVMPDQILEHVWGEGSLGNTHLLQVHISRLRRKLNDNARYPSYIFTRPGIGYLMVKQKLTCP